MNNKSFYTVLLTVKATIPIGNEIWIKQLHLKDNRIITDTYFFVFNYIHENKIKIFRWKLLQYIIPTRQLLYKWKIAESNLCNICNVEEDYNHLFISCNYLKQFWDQIKKLLKTIHFDFNITLVHLVIGYKIYDREYFDINYLFSILAFSIYKSYYVSEQKTKNIDVFKLFACKLRKKVREFNLKHKSVLLQKVLKRIETI